MGEETTLSPTDGSVQVTLTQEPIYVRGPIDGVREGGATSLSARYTEAGRTEIAATGDGGSVALGEDSLSVGESTTVPAYPVGGQVVGLLQRDGQTTARLVAPVEGAKATATFGQSATAAGMRAWMRGAGGNNPEPAVKSYGGENCWELRASDDRQWVDVDVDDRFMYDVDRTVPVTVRYYDDGGGSLGLVYDGQGPRGSSEVEAEPLSVGTSGEWKEHTFQLQGAEFAGEYQFGKDLEFGFWTPEKGASDAPICVSGVTVGEGVPIGSLPTTTSLAVPGAGASEGQQDGTDQQNDGGSAGENQNAVDDSNAGTDESGTPTDAGGPGLGALVAVVAIVVGALLHRRP
jgi:hypothetical protein